MQRSTLQKSNNYFQSRPICYVDRHTNSLSQNSHNACFLFASSSYGYTYKDLTYYSNMMYIQVLSCSSILVKYHVLWPEHWQENYFPSIPSLIWGRYAPPISKSHHPLWSPPFSKGLLFLLELFSASCLNFTISHISQLCTSQL